VTATTLGSSFIWELLSFHGRYQVSLALALLELGLPL
jgi:hypothetical protein